MKKVFALDIGGTSVKYGLVDAYGYICGQGGIKTQASDGGERLFMRVCAVIRENMPEDCLGIGVSTAGQVDPRDGSIRFATDNLPGWTGIRLRQRLEDLFERTCLVENDVNAAALGESWLGAARGADTALVLTLGTGIGGAVVTEGRLFRGSRGSAGEVGHICLHPGGRPCTCGQRGCFEQYASTLALERAAGEQLMYIENGAADVFKLAASGDMQARMALAKWMEDLACGIASLVTVLDPDVVVLGGAVSLQGEALVKPVEALVRSRVMPSFRDVAVLSAQLGNSAGLLGMACGFFTGT